MKFKQCVVRMRINLVNVGASAIRLIYFYYQCNSESSLFFPSSGPFTRPHPAVWRMVFGEW